MSCVLCLLNRRTAFWWVKKWQQLTNRRSPMVQEYNNRRWTFAIDRLWTYLVSVSLHVNDKCVGTSCATRINSLRAFFNRNINLYLQFLSFLYIYMAQAVQILSLGGQGPTYVTVSIMGADDPVTQGARASTTMILTKLKRDNSVPAC